ncbi:MAG TPA: alpha/beta hydrolase-fold protein, partial [Sporichthyaceae bacterium]|nr:alpha/beta hydrolase-fold protein [Sporichthyaceae bacterium]
GMDTPTLSFGGPTGTATPRSGPAKRRDHAPAPSALDPAAASALAQSLHPTNWAKASEWTERGAVVNLPITGDGGGPAQDVLAYLPPQWFAGGAEAAALPMVEVLTGYPGTPHTVIDKLHAPDVLLQDIDAGTAHPMVLVITRPVEPFPRDTECVDVPNGPSTFSYLATALPTAAASILHLHPSALGAMGYSTGGYCALKLAMMRPQEFSAGASMSGYYRALPEANSGNLFGANQVTGREQNDLDWRLTHLPAPSASVMIATSHDERYDDGYAAAQSFLSLVHSPMSATEMVLPHGGHNFGTWTAEFPRLLSWMDQRLQSATSR